ncbi:BOI-related E3 ubiquitin-protein ligase 1, partial [Bienertia sinuspersici]
MAVETEFFSENLDYPSQNWTITNSNLSLQQQKHFLQQQMEMGYCNFDQGISSYPSSSSCTTTATFTENCLPSMAYNQPLATLLQKHNHELDQFLHLQGERLKEALHQQKRQQMLLLANSYESRTVELLREKEEDLEKLRAKTRLLEDYLKKAETETEVWQSIARKKEEMVIRLNNMLLFAQQNNIINNNINYYNNNVDGVGEDNDAESVGDCQSLNKNEEIKNKFNCKWCKNCSLTVVLLPCKHLCCCKECEPLLGLCPVCHSVKQSSLEIFSLEK